MSGWLYLSPVFPLQAERLSGNPLPSPVTLACVERSARRTCAPWSGIDAGGRLADA